MESPKSIEFHEQQAKELRFTNVDVTLKNGPDHMLEINMDPHDHSLLYFSNCNGRKSVSREEASRLIEAAKW